MNSTTFFIIFIPLLSFILLFVNLLLAPHNPNNCIGKSIIKRGKLSNSGDALKILITSHIWKYMSGWSNYSGIVKSQKICENKMGNRGSKSNKINTLFVKEQRVDGSYIGYLNKKNNSMLKCTLVGFERSYQIKIPSNSINLIRNLSTLDSKLDPGHPPSQSFYFLVFKK